MSEIVCRCDQENEPRCGFCDDDLYCPQCGEMITKVFSRDKHPGSGVIWIYADEEAEDFRFSLSSQARGADRREVPGFPQLDLQKSRLHVVDRFERVVEEVGPRADGLGTEYRLKPQAMLAEVPDWIRLVPQGGMTAWLDAVGGFHRTRFDFRICQAPQFDVRLVGDGILDDEDLDQASWRVWKRGLLRIELHLEARTAPVHLEGAVVLEAEHPGDDRLFRLEDALAAGEQLVPGQHTVLALVVDSREWEDGEAKNVTVRLAYGGRRLYSKTLRLRMVALGNIAFRPDWLMLEGLRLGDRLSSRERSSPLAGLSVTNDGAEAVFLGKPRVEVEAGPPAAAWIAVRWPGELAGEDLILLEPGESRAIELSIDLSRLTSADLPPDKQLKAAIALEDELRQWRLQIRIPNLAPRPSHAGWLAIDFGSTNTYAAILAQQAGQTGSQVQPLLNPDDPERFDSVIFFADVSDPAKPVYEVGPGAAKQGEACASALISGMKRWLGTGAERQWVVRDPNNREASYDVETLVQLLLADVIRRSEDALRARIERIGLSFPANFGPQRIAVLERVAQRLAEQLAEESPPRTLVCDRPRLDEATAVALAFVLDPQQAKRLEPLVRETKSLVVASFDFGGGTIDTAVIRIQFDYTGNHLIFSKYASTYLGIGGDVNLGGENVTLSLQELLVGRLREVIGEAISGEPAPEIALARRGEQGTLATRTNFEALWSAAEQMKIALCRAAAAAANEEPDAPAESDAPAGDESLATHLLAQLNRLRAVFSEGDIRGERPLLEHERIRTALEEAVAAGRLLVSLDEVYDHEIEADLRGGVGQSIRQRLTRCVAELCSFADRHQETIDVVVLAGAGARLPLVEALIRERLPDALVEFDRQRPKSKVASGLARFLTLRQLQPERVRQIACPVDFLQHAIGIVEPASQTFVEIVPAWSPITDAKRWFPFPEVQLEYLWSSNAERRLLLWSEEAGRPRPLGAFDLSQPGGAQPSAEQSETEQPDAVSARLPENLHPEHRLELRFADVRQIELRVVDTRGTYGYWRLVGDSLD
jgi:molecular chaperone DnaK (HSP70)